VEPLKLLDNARSAEGLQDAVYIALQPLHDNARAFARDQNIVVAGQRSGRSAAKAKSSLRPDGPAGTNRWGCPHCHPPPRRHTVQAMPAIPPSPKYALPTTALLLSGGGARAAYQVGVLEAISDLRRACYAHHTPNPFGVLAGTSAGSINATALACGADHFDLAVQRLASHWRALDVGSVYRADHPSLLRTGMHWLGMLALGWAMPSRRRMRPRSLLDNSPLRQRLQQLLPMHRIPSLLDHGYLHALAVTASSYTTGEHDVL
jgi:NTE family protein